MQFGDSGKIPCLDEPVGVGLEFGDAMIESAVSDLVGNGPQGFIFGPASSCLDRKMMRMRTGSSSNSFGCIKWSVTSPC